MQCASVKFSEKFRGRLNLLCIFPGGHWIRANIRCGHRKVVCLFKQETSEGRDATMETRLELYDETCKYSQPAIYIYR